MDPSYWRLILLLTVRRCILHPVGSKIPLTDDSFCMILSLLRMSVCCTPGRIKDPPYRRFLLHDFVVVAYVGVLYTRQDQRSALLTIPLARFCPWAIRRCVVHLVGSKILLTDDSFCMILSLCRTSVCCTAGRIKDPPVSCYTILSLCHTSMYCTPGRIKGPPYRRFLLYDFVVVPYFGVLYTQ